MATLNLKKLGGKQTGCQFHKNYLHKNRGT